MSESTIRRKIEQAETPQDAALVATIIAQSFSSLPVCQWLVPDPKVRVRTLAAVFDLHVQHALTFGVVHLLTQVDPVTGSGAGVGAAVWFDHTHPVPTPPEYDDHLQEVTGRRYARFAVLDMLLEDHHPPRPHHYLAFLAVEAGSQAAGIGSALLRHHHALLDRQHLPAYLEATSVNSRRLYGRHGYIPHGPAFDVQTGADFFPMWRNPDGSNR